MRNLQNYFLGLGCRIGKYQNPADFIIKLAQVPELCNKNLDNDKLELNYENDIRKEVDAQIEKDTKKYNNIVTKINEFGADRRVNICVQFYYLFVRNL